MGADGNFIHKSVPGGGGEAGGTVVEVVVAPGTVLVVLVVVGSVVDVLAPGIVVDEIVVLLVPDVTESAKLKFSGCSRVANGFAQFE